MATINTLGDILDALKEAAEEVVSDVTEENDEPKTWEDHEEIVDDSEDCDEVTIVALLDSAVRDTLHRLNSGIIEFEDGDEMLSTAKAVSILESLKGN